MNRLIVLGMVFIIFLSSMFVASSRTTRDEIDSWTWSKNIERGIYSWNVTTFQYLGEVVTYKSEELDLVEGSIIELHVNELLHGIEFYQADKNFELPVDVFYDNQEVDQHNYYPVDFIYPNLIGWTNGSYDNLFELDKPEFQEILDFSNDSRTEGNHYVIYQEDQNRKYHTVRAIDSGLLLNWKLVLGNSILEYSFLGVELFPVPENNVSFNFIKINNATLIAIPVIMLLLGFTITRFKMKNN